MRKFEEADYKFCSRCGCIYPVVFFYKNKYNSDGLNEMCMDCRKKEDKKYYQSHKEERKKYQKKYCQSHKEEIKKYSRDYYQSHKKESREYRQSHKEERKEYIRNYRKKHPFYDNEYSRQWKEKHPLYMKTLREKSILNGICAQCSCRPIDYSRSFYSCTVCLDKHKNYNKNKREVIKYETECIDH